MRTIAIVVGAMVLGGSAYAADMPLKAPVVAPNWSGWYVGVNGGYDWGKADTGATILNNPFAGAPVFAAFSGAMGSNAIPTSGGLAGGQVGFLLQSGSVVGGFEASVDWFNAKGSITRTQGIFPPAFAGITGWTENAHSNWLALFTGRVGFDLGAWYPYVTAGAAVANINYSTSWLETNAGGATAAASVSRIEPGVAFGGGLEWRWDSHWSFRGEYLALMFNRIGATAPIIAPVPVGGAAWAVSTSFYQSLVRAAVSYKW
jgi:outer membrane immunogenic protein